jgi:hypothetical protein
VKTPNLNPWKWFSTTNHHSNEKAWRLVLCSSNKTMNFVHCWYPSNKKRFHVWLEVMHFSHYYKCTFQKWCWKRSLTGTSVNKNCFKNVI